MRQLGKIKCLENSSFSESQGQGEPPNQTYVLLFHGYGADAYDLQALAEVMDPEQKLHWLFPQGILEVPIGPGWTGRAWWNLDMQALQEMAVRGTQREMGNEKPESLPKIRGLIFEMIAQLKVPWHQIVLGGFSQGAMLATDIYLNAPETPKGLLILSGALINKSEWQPLVSKRAGQKFFISHGQNDAVLPHRGAQQLETLLTQGGMKGGLMSFLQGCALPQHS